MPRLKSRKTIIAGLATAGALGLGIAVPAVAFADNGSPSPAPSGSTSAPEKRDGDGERRGPERGKELGEKFAKALAEELGVPEEKVTAALEKLREQHKPEKPEGDRGTDRRAGLEERLEQAVKDGKLTQEQADAVKAAFDADVLPGPGGRGHQEPKK
jgi:hypothetical protein